MTFLDGQTVVFGRVVQGHGVFKLIEKMGTMNERPQPSVKIESADTFSI